MYDIHDDRHFTNGFCFLGVASMVCDFVYIPFIEKLHPLPWICRMRAPSPQQCIYKARQVHAEAQHTPLPHTIVRRWIREEHKKAAATACRRHNVDAQMRELGLDELVVLVAEEVLVRQNQSLLVSDEHASPCALHVQALAQEALEFCQMRHPG
jgi:uncharacterized protein YacL (UPF0231 family)